MYFPKDILKIIVSYCGHTLEQRQRIMWSSIIPHRLQTACRIPRNFCKMTYWFTNKRLLSGLCVEWIRGRNCIEGAMITRPYLYS
jgi:hypothetical protein